MKQRIDSIDEDYPLEIPVPVLFACQIGGLVLLLLGGMGMGWKIYKTRKELQTSLAMFVKGDNKGKDFQKLMSTLMNVYTGMTPKPSTSKATPTSLSTDQKDELAEQPALKKPRIDKDPGAQQIEDVILQVLKKGTDVKKFGKYCEKQQSKV